MLVAALWVTGMLAYQLPGPTWLKGAAVAVWGGFALTTAMAVGRARAGRWPGPVFVAVLVLCGVWWLLLTPRQDRVWADDVAQRLSVVEFDGNRVVLESLSALARRRQDARDGTRWDPAQPLLANRTPAIDDGEHHASHLGHHDDA